jgi:peptidoglycan/LPS O-acetylase OafA/YrhL
MWGWSWRGWSSISTGRSPSRGDRTVAAIFTNLALIQAWHIHPHLTWNGPSWTLSAEWACYLIFAGLVLIAPKRFRWIGLVLAIVGGVLVVSYARRWMNTTYDFAVPRAVYGFFLGCLLQGLWTHIPRMKGLAATGLEVAAVVATCVFVAWAQGPVTIAVSLVFVLLVWVFAGEEGRVSRMLDHPAW